MSMHMSITTNELCELEQAARTNDPTGMSLKIAQRFCAHDAAKRKMKNGFGTFGQAKNVKIYKMGARVLFVSTHSSPDDLVKMIVGDNVKPTTKHDKCNDYEWIVKNDVPVRLCALNLTSIYKLFYKFPETVKMVVVYINLDNENWLPALNKIRYFLVNICKPTLRVCCIKEWSQNVRDNERINMWCKQYDFEIVNMNPDEEDLHNAWETSTKIGIERIAQIIREWY